MGIWQKCQDASPPEMASQTPIHHSEGRLPEMSLKGESMKIGIKKQVDVEAKELRLHLKVCDCFYASLHDQDGQELKDYEGYVPAFMPGQHFGDYVYLNIDLDTGQITNWKKPEAKQIEDFINAEAD